MTRDATPARTSSGGPAPTAMWSLPLRVDAHGCVAAGREDLLVDSARLVLEVAPGERPLVPTFGCRLHTLPSIRSEHERQLAAALAEEALARWVPWLGVERVDVVKAMPASLRLVLDAGARRGEMEIAWRGGRARGGSGETEEPRG